MGDAALPIKLAEHVDLISGLSEFFDDKTTRNLMYPKAEQNPSKVKNSPQYDIFVTPSLLKTYYNIPSDLVVTNSTNIQGIAAFTDYFSLGALQQFVDDQKLMQPRVTRIGPNCEPDCVRDALSPLLTYRTNLKVTLTFSTLLELPKMLQLFSLTKLRTTGFYNLLIKS
jgi:hypothetical protein